MTQGKTQVLEAVTCVWLFLPDYAMSYQLRYELHWVSKFKRENDIEAHKCKFAKTQLCKSSSTPVDLFIFPLYIFRHVQSQP